MASERDDGRESDKMAELDVCTARARGHGLQEIVARVMRVEELLAQGLTPRQAAARVQLDPPEGLGLRSRTLATRYVAAALYRLQQDATTEPNESKIARMEAFWHAQIQRALARKRTWEANGNLVVEDVPDLRAANEAAKVLSQLYGLIARKESE